MYTNILFHKLSSYSLLIMYAIAYLFANPKLCVIILTYLIGLFAALEIQKIQQNHPADLSE